MSQLHLFVVPSWILAASPGLVVAIAFARGGWRERLIAVTTLSGPIWIVIDPFGPGPIWGAAHIWRMIADDAFTLAACAACLHGATRYWVIWANTAALANLATDLVILLSGSTNWAGAWATSLWSYLLGAILCWSALTSSRRGVRSEAAPI